MNSNQIIDKHGEAAYDELRHKHFLSVFWFIFLNISSISLISILVILNLYAIRWNTHELYSQTRMWFVVLAILNGFIGVITSVVGFLKLKVNLRKINESLKVIKKLKSSYKNRTGIFKTISNRDEKYIQLVLNAIKQAE